MNKPIFLEKREFIVEYLKKHKYVTVTDKEFVDAYIKRFNAKYNYKMWGSHFCKDLSTQLSRMYKSNWLDRGRIVLSPHIDGFPNWCYSYSLKEDE